MIYIITHKKFKNPNLKDYKILQVGVEEKKNEEGMDLGYLKDNIGENISKLNSSFCELTGLYWIWKNTEDNIKGLVHYRRYFGKSNLSGKIKDIYSYDKVISLLNKCDIVVPYIEYFKQSAKDELMIECCTEEIFNNLRNIIDVKYNDYLEAFDKYFNQNKTVLFNMMVCKKDIFDSYCKWLFDILFELERITDLNQLNDYQRRIFGFLAERLLNVWIYKNNLKPIHLNIVNTELSLKKKIIIILRRLYHRLYFRSIYSEKSY